MCVPSGGEVWCGNWRQGQQGQGYEEMASLGIETGERGPKVRKLCRYDSTRLCAVQLAAQYLLQL